MEEAKVTLGAKTARKPKAEKQSRGKGRRGAEGYELPKRLLYHLSDPGYTIYHRAALGGLAATVRAWQDEDNDHDPPEGVAAKLTRDTVKLSWAADLPAAEAVRRILAASFKRTDEGLIDLAGHNIREDQRGLRLAVHDGIMKTFLQSKDSRKAEKIGLPYPIKTADDEEPHIFFYQPVNNYFHQVAHEKMQLRNSEGITVAELMQWHIPGAMRGARTLEAPFKDAMLLMFLMVGSAAFLIRPRNPKENVYSCLIVPDVTDLQAFAKSLHNIAAVGQNFDHFSDSYLGHIVGGAEEAALRFLIDLKAYDVSLERGVKGCLAITMNKVAWDKKQFNRSIVVRLKDKYAEMDLFLAANRHLGGRIAHKSRKGESQIWLESYVPALVAANLASEPERSWCANFKSLVSTKEDFKRMQTKRRGLSEMQKAIKDETDQKIIRAFQEAWRLKMRSLYERARREGADGDRLIEVEREKMRNSILRAKTADALAGWFLQFCADATREYQSAALARDLSQLRQFIFNPRNFERFQNLCLFALVSYARDEAATQQTATTGGQS